ncbi:MAG TPA: hypothetical protein VJJ98_06990 [Sedimentisphaerales bacterium]|nr:hypothetical protein [Sedimentisphaerales bacterium]
MARESYRKRANALVWIIVMLGLVVFVLYAIPHWINPPCRIPALEVRQNAQFHSIEAALELFNNEFDRYPPSDANDPTGRPYCGAMKLAEALMGQDILGFHGDSVFRADGKDANEVTELYDVKQDPDDWFRARKGPYLPPESVDSPTLAQIYGQGNTALFNANSRVLCDTYRHRFKTGHKGGMPVLYYKADTSKTAHDVNDPDNPDNIYDYRDNHALLALGVPGEPEKKHPMFADPRLSYKITKSEVTTISRSSRADTYILISAGEDGLYGTRDDICNFQFRFPDE